MDSGVALFEWRVIHRSRHFGDMATTRPSGHNTGLLEAGLYTSCHAGNACPVVSCTLPHRRKSAGVYLRCSREHYTQSHGGGRDGKHVPHRFDGVIDFSRDSGRTSNPVQRRYLRGSRGLRRRPADDSVHGCVRDQAGPGGERLIRDLLRRQRKPDSRERDLRGREWECLSERNHVSKYCQSAGYISGYGRCCVHQFLGWVRVRS